MESGQEHDTKPTCSHVDVTSLPWIHVSMMPFRRYMPVRVRFGAAMIF